MWAEGDQDQALDKQFDLVYSQMNQIKVYG